MSSRELTGGNFLWGNFPRGNFPGGIYLEPLNVSSYFLHFNVKVKNFDFLMRKKLK